MKMANDVAWKTNLTNHYNLVINMRVFCRFKSMLFISPQKKKKKKNERME